MMVMVWAPGCAPVCPSVPPSAAAALNVGTAPTLALAATAEAKGAAGAWFCSDPQAAEKVRAWIAASGSDNPDLAKLETSGGCNPFDVFQSPLYVDERETVAWTFSPDDGQTWLSGANQVARIRFKVGELPGGRDAGFLYGYADVRDLKPAT